MMKKYSHYLFLFLVFTLTLHTANAQQDVFSRSEVSTGNFGDAQLPWFYGTSNNSQGDPDNGNTTRNFVKIGHNNNTTMTTNGRFYQVATLDFQSSASAARTINNTGGGLSASGGIYNASSATHTFNTPIGIDGINVQLHTNSSGGFIFNQDIFINNNTVEFGNSGAGDITVNGLMQGTGNVKKVGANILIVTGSHTYTGTTSIEGGLFRLQGSLINSDVTVKSGATLEIDGNTSVKSITVETGGNVIVNAGESLTVVNNLTSNGIITLNSDSQNYSSLIVNGTSTGDVIYNRHINMNAASGGNDLVSAPVSGMTFGDLRLANSNILSGTIGGNGPFYLFGPFDNSSVNNYVLYEETVDDGVLLSSGTGYRTGSTDGGTYTFTGAVETSTKSTPITFPSGGSKWNLIGNPYPSYLNASAFLSASNTALLDPSATAIYGYNNGTDATAGGIYTIVNNLTALGYNLAPGQGFFVASNPTGGSIEFSPSMRSILGSDDFIQGRDANVITNLKLSLSSSTDSFLTDIYFTEFSTLGLDPGYDASLFGGSIPAFALYSRLVMDDMGVPLAIQALGETDYSDVTVPLGVSANQGEQLTFTINTSTLPTTVEVYLDDIVANSSTLLNSSNYILTPSTPLSGTGRFFLRFTDNSLSTPENNLESLLIYASKGAKNIIVKGELFENSTLELFDIQGRLVKTSKLDNTSTENRIDVSSISSGIYVVKLQNKNRVISQKLIIQ